MNKNDVSIATMTWARDDKEEKLLCEALSALSKLDLPVFITDGGSGTDFLDFIKSFSNFTLLKPETKGLWPQVQTSLKAAHQSGTPFIIYTEPDKLEFFKTGLPQFLDQISPDEHTGIVLAVRSEAGFASYPAFQKMCETTINNCCSEVTGNDTDYTYGPFFVNRELIPYLDELKPTIGWGWRLYVFVMANRLNYAIESFEGEYFCPPDQQGDDARERVYRMSQLSESIDAIVISSRIIL